MRCGECGSKEMKPKNAKGRKFPYKQWDVILKVDIDLITCEKCGNIILRGEDCKRLDDACRETLIIDEARFDSFLRSKGLDI